MPEMVTARALKNTKEQQAQDAHDRQMHAKSGAIPPFAGDCLVATLRCHLLEHLVEIHLHGERHMQQQS
jgi:hypothetical protein